jgi:hypothetical protein
MGAVTARNVGRATIRADLAPLSATLPVSVTPRPVIGPLAVEANAAALTMVRFSTDTAAPAAVVIAQRIGTGELVLVFAKQDPAAKQHRALLTGLVSGASYSLTPAAVNAFFLAGVGTPVVITVP